MSLALWNHPVTAERYRNFSERHDRYRAVAEALVAAAGAAPGLRVLDAAAGLGCAALACLDRMGADDRILATEAAAAMRTAGRARTAGRRIDWLAEPPEAACFDLVICSAAIWAMGPVDAVIRELARRVAPGGALAFSMPSAYLGEPDAPGGGADPWLVTLLAALTQLGFERPATQPMAQPTAPAIENALRREGLAAQHTRLRLRLDQAAFRDWMLLPPVNDSLLGALPPEDRPAIVARAAAVLDLRSWRWEGWSLWVARRD